MGQYIQEPVGTAGSKANKGVQTSAGNPGGVVNPQTKSATGPESFGWKALDYKFGDRPLYQLMKNKAQTGSFCGKGAGETGGMASAASQASSLAAMQAAAGAGAGAGAGENPDTITPGPGVEEAAAAPTEEWNAIGGS